jgi:hypothetical protein
LKYALKALDAIIYDFERHNRIIFGTLAVVCLSIANAFLALFSRLDGGYRRFHLILNRSRNSLWGTVLWCIFHLLVLGILKKEIRECECIELFIVVAVEFWVMGVH